MKFLFSPCLPVVCALACSCSGSASKQVDPPPAGNIDDLTAPDTSQVEATCKPALPQTSRLIRLTHRQYANTLAELMGEAVNVGAVLAPDPTPFRFDNDAELLRVSEPLARDYRRVAEDIGSRLAGNAERAKQLTECANQDTACATRFIKTFGAKVFRRPLRSEELTAFAKLYEVGRTTGGFPVGIGWTVEAMLQTPDFLYRVSVDDQPGPEGLITPSAWELASLLSFTLWNSMPDDELFTAAAQGKLLGRVALREQVRRMLNDRRARDMVGDFHNQFMEGKGFANLQRDPKVFPTFGSLGPAMQKEIELFSTAAVLDDELPFAAFMTAPFTYLNGALAKLYGLPAPTNTDANGFSRVTLDGGKRGGLLTQPGFLSSRAHQDASAPILRGTFVLKHALCMDLPPPPPDVDLTLPTPEPGMTTRELVTRITSGGACKSCHSFINPIGFAFENFNAVGQWRDMDAGKPVDASGSVDLGEERVDFTGPMPLLNRLAQSPEAATCYAKNWLSFILARQLGEADRCLPESLAQLVGDNDLTIKDLIAQTVATRAFLYRAPNAEEGKQP